MSKIFIKGNITGERAHIGDVIYNNYETYIEEKKLTTTEKELVKIIFDNTQSCEEREEILESLKQIKKERLSKDMIENASEQFAKKNFLDFKKVSYDIAVGLLNNILAAFIISPK